MHEHVSPPGGGEDHQVHDDHHQVVMPARRFLAPETGVPNENLSLNGPEHYQDQCDRGNLREHAEHDAQAARKLDSAQNNSEPLAHSYALASFFCFGQVTPTAGDEHDAHHHSQQQQAQIDEPAQLWKDHRVLHLPQHNPSM